MEGFSAERDTVKTGAQIDIGKSFILFFKDDRKDLLVVKIYRLLIINNKKKYSE